MRNSSTLVATFAAFGVATFLAGCGNSENGGANTRPTVTVKPKSSDPAETADTGSAAGTTTDGSSDGAAGGGTGTFKGVVVVKGNAPEQNLLVRKGDTNAKDAAVCAAEDIPNEALAVGENGGLANVFVFLPKAPKGAEVAPTPEEPAIFDQKNCRFLPHCLIVRAGQTINVLNDDAILHNTHTYPLSNEAFNKSIPVNERNGIPLVYTSVEKLPVSVGCDIHPWMRAWHLPLDHDFAAVTDENGEFEIENLPAGTHEFVVWHSKAGYIERKFKGTVKSGEPQSVTIEADAAKLANGPGDVKSINISALGR